MSKNTDTSREVRLWIGAITSLVTTAVIVGSNPYVRWRARSAVNGMKDYFKAKKKEREQKKNDGPEIKVNYSKVVYQEEL